MTSYRTWLDERKVPQGPWVTRPAPVGRSGEASETRSGSTVGEHAVPAQQEGAQPFISEEQP